jgi:hypothetical protein
MKNLLNKKSFPETIAFIDEKYTFTPTTFKNGNQINNAGENNGSCKIFAFALLQQFTKEETLSLFGDFYQDVLIVAGSHSRTLKTSEYIANILALPVCVDDRLDKYITPNYQSGTLIDGLKNLVKALPPVKSPKVILVATSLMSIIEWVKSLNLKNYSNDFEKVIMHSSDNDTIPSVLIAGFTNESGKEEWIIDLPELS